MSFFDLYCIIVNLESSIQFSDVSLALFPQDPGAPSLQSLNIRHPIGLNRLEITINIHYKQNPSMLT